MLVYILYQKRNIDDERLFGLQRVGMQSVVRKDETSPSPCGSSRRTHSIFAEHNAVLQLGIRKRCRITEANVPAKCRMAINQGQITNLQ